jgi:hypothetical protein
LKTKALRVDLPARKLLDLCIPTWQRKLGRFTEYGCELTPGYQGLTIIAKDGLLKSAFEWSCTHIETYFDALTSEDKKEYQKLRKEKSHVPYERFIGRWGWARPPMREWSRGGADD